jgi:hypothetical protein
MAMVSSFCRVGRVLRDRLSGASLAAREPRTAAGGGGYQACVPPQCGQSTEVDTVASNT